MAKYLDGTGLGTVWGQIKSVFLSKSGGTMTGTITTSEGNHAGIKIGSTYITSAGSGNVVFQNNTTGIRFGTDAWDYNQWAGLKYVHSSKIIYLGLADGSVFTANTAQSGGKLYTPGIDQICVGNGTYTVYHTGNLPAYPTKDSWNYDDRYLKLSGGTISNTSTTVPLTIQGSTEYSCITFTQSGSGAHHVTFGIKSDGTLFVTPIDNWSNEYYILHTGNYTTYCATAGHKHNYSQIEAGNISLGAGTNYINLRTGHSGYDGGVYYSTPGNEAVVFANKNTATSWMFAPGVSPTSLKDWTTITPSLQIKNGTVAINKQIANGASLSYNLDVNGSANATTLYQNGVQVSVVGHTHSYLPLSGGTIYNGSMHSVHTLSTTSGSADAWNKDGNTMLRLQSTNNLMVFSIGSPGNERTGFIQVGHSDSDNYAHITSALHLNKLGGTVYINNNVAWHAGNDGSGSGLDADLLDGHESSYFATSGHTHSYLPLSGGTMALGEGLQFHSDDNYFGNNLDARIISLLDGNDTVCDGGLIIDERGTLNGNTTVTELLRIRDSEFKWKGNTIYHSGNFTPGSYLPLSGGTMTGVLTLLGSQYNAYTTGVGALNLNNSDITGVNSILTSDLSESWSESIGFKRSNGNYDTIRAANGTFYLGVNNGTEYTAIHSGNYSSYALPLSGGTLSGDLTFSHGSSENDQHITWASGSHYQRLKVRDGWTDTFIFQYSTDSGSTWSDYFTIQNGTAKIGTNTVIHSGNIGSQSVNYATSSGTASSCSGNSLTATRFAYITDWNSPKNGANVINLMTDTSTSATTNGAPVRYASGISIVTNYVGFQLASYGGAGESLYFRKLQDNGTWHSWYEVITTANYTTYCATSGHNHDGTYLKLSGGTLSGNISTASFWSGTDGLGVYFEGNSTSGIRIQYPRTIDGNSRSNYDQLVLKAGELKFNNYLVYHSGNLTPSTIGAATSSHNHDSTYLKLSGGTVSGKLTISANNYLNQLVLNRGNDGGTWGPSISFCNNGTFMAALGVDVNGVLYRGDSGSTKYAILHEGNYTSYCATANHNHDSTYLKLSGGTLTGAINLTNTNAKIAFGSLTTSPITGYKAPSLVSSGVGIYSRYGGSSDEGALIITEDTCVIYNSADTGWNFQVMDKDLGTDMTVDATRSFGVNQNHQAFSLGGFVKSGSSDSYVLLGGGGHKAESSLSVANADTLDGVHASGFLSSSLVAEYSNSVSASEEGWYRVARFKTTDMARGITTFYLTIGGGSWSPNYAKFQVYGTWARGRAYKLKIDTNTSVWDVIRTTYDDTYVYIEVHFNVSCTAASLFVPNPSWNKVEYSCNNYWEWFNGALPAGGGTVTSEQAASNGDNSSEYVRSAGFIKNSSSDSYVLLGGGGHKAVSDFATSGHNHDSVYVKKVGDDVSGTIKRTYTASNQTPMLWMDGNNYDNYIWQISSGTSTKQYYGYGLKYIGTGNDVNNNLRLIADNQNQTGITAIGINQNGQVGIGSDPSTDYRLYVNGSAKINSGSLQVYPIGGSYNDGIRIHARSSDSNWSALMLCGSDNTGDTGTSANSWFIGNNTGNFYITRNGSASGTAYLSCVNNAWSVNGNAIIHSGNIGSQSVSYATTAAVLLTNDTSQSADACYSENAGLRFWRYNGTSSTTGQAGGDGWILSWSWNPGSVGGQIYVDDNPSKTICIRGRNNDANKTFTSWAKILHSDNYTDYTVTKTGTGASGTWGISISGNATTATTADTVGGYNVTNLKTVIRNSKYVDISSGAGWYRILDCTTYSMSFFITFYGGYNYRPPTPVTYLVSHSYNTTAISQIGKSAYLGWIQAIRAVHYDTYKFYIDVKFGVSGSNAANEVAFEVTPMDSRYTSFSLIDYTKQSDGDGDAICNTSTSFDVDYADSAGSVAWSNITGKPSDFDSAITNSEIDAIFT